MNHLLVKNYSLIGLHWGLYFVRDPSVLRDAQDAISKLYAEGKISPLVSETYPLVDAKSALDALASRKTTGKVVLIP
jgi:NADPH2:quinone reductase